MKKGWLYALIGVLTIGVSTAVASALPVKEKAEEKTYDFNSIEEFETYVRNDIHKATGKYNDVFNQKLDELIASPILEENSIFPTLIEDFKTVNTFYGYDSSETFGYVDEDIAYIFDTYYTLILFAFNNYILTFDVSDGDFSSNDNSDFVEETNYDVLRSFAVYVVAMRLGEPHIVSKDFETRKLDNVEVGKINFTAISNHYTYDVNDIGGENAQWADGTDLMFYGNISINFENEKIELTQAQFDEMNSSCASNNLELSSHQLSHIVVK